MFCCQIGHIIFNKRFFRVAYKTYSQNLSVKEPRIAQLKTCPLL